VPALAMSEKQLQSAVIELAKTLGWKVAHFGNTMKNVRRGNGYVSIPDRGASGFPDLVLVRRPRLVFAELKTKHNQLTEAQMDWIQQLEQVDGQVDAYVWRPADWESGIIHRRLK
jgi:VRR-NUC domain.